MPGWAATPATPATPAPPAKPPSKLRAIVPIVVIVGILGVVLYATRNNQSADDLAVGICFDLPDKAEVTTVEKHPCTEPHDAEVFHNVEYTQGGTYPITLTFDQFVDGACTPIFGTYTGVAYDDSADLSYGYFYPSTDTWDKGDRTLTCYVQRTDETKLTNSVKAS